MASPIHYIDWRPGLERALEEWQPRLERKWIEPNLCKAPTATKVVTLPRKSNSFGNRMATRGPVREYLFTNLSFRLRETTTFVPLRSFWKTHGARKVRMKNLGRTSGQALSQPGPAMRPAGHFFFAHLCGEITLNLLLRKPLLPPIPHET